VGCGPKTARADIDRKEEKWVIIPDLGEDLGIAGMLQGRRA
jgi:hypothetical protein